VIAQMNRTIQKMKNELTRLRRDGSLFPSEDQNIEVLAQEKKRTPTHEKRVRIDRMDE